jgi:Meckel syndrome type 1 protein
VSVPADRPPYALELAEIDRLLARPVPRDLADPELWARSLRRSRQRRALAAIERKHAPRRKAAALAVSGAVAASPVLPPLAAGQKGAGAGSGPVRDARVGSVVRLGSDALLELGDTGQAVAAVQHRLGVRADGVFGPVTQAAVRDFQARWGGLPVTGRVDARTWAALFDVPITVVSPRRAGAPRVVTVKPAASGPAQPAASAGAARVGAVEAVASGQARPAASAGAPAVVAAASGSAQPAAPSDATVAPGQQGQPAPDATGAPQAPPAGGGAQTAAPGARTGGAEPGRGRTAPTTDGSRVTAPPATAPARVTPVADTSPSAAHMPVQGTVTGTYGEQRQGHRHAGVDIAAPVGTPVSAAGSGTVTQASADGGYGNLVCIDHGDGVSTCYAHLSRFATTQGAYVEVGDVIGYVGSTGNATGPHLHFEVRRNGVAEDPTPYLRGTATLPHRTSLAATTRTTQAVAAPAPAPTASAAETAPARATPEVEASAAAQSPSAGAGAASAPASTEVAASAAAQSPSAGAETAPAPATPEPAATPPAAAAGPAASAAPVATAPEAPVSAAPATQAAGSGPSEAKSPDTSPASAGTGGTAAPPAAAPPAPTAAPAHAALASGPAPAVTPAPAAAEAPATTPTPPAPEAPAATPAGSQSESPLTAPALAADESPAAPAPSAGPGSTG